MLLSKRSGYCRAVCVALSFLATFPTLTASGHVLPRQTWKGYLISHKSWNNGTMETNLAPGSRPWYAPAHPRKSITLLSEASAQQQVAILIGPFLDGVLYEPLLPHSSTPVADIYSASSATYTTMTSLAVRQRKRQRRPFLMKAAGPSSDRASGRIASAGHPAPRESPIGRNQRVTFATRRSQIVAQRSRWPIIFHL